MYQIIYFICILLILNICWILGVFFPCWLQLLHCDKERVTSWPYRMNSKVNPFFISDDDNISHIFCTKSQIIRQVQSKCLQGYLGHQEYKVMSWIPRPLVGYEGPNAPTERGQTELRWTKHHQTERRRTEHRKYPMPDKAQR
jgi:hypothetical protein